MSFLTIIIFGNSAILNLRVLFSDANDFIFLFSIVKYLFRFLWNVYGSRWLVLWAINLLLSYLEVFLKQLKCFFHEIK